MTRSQKPRLRRSAASFVTAAYEEYASFLRTCAPCIRSFFERVHHFATSCEVVKP